MKKRAIISLVITVITMLCTNKLWLDIKPVNFGFDINGRGNAHISIQLNKRNDNKFKKVKEEHSKINFDKTKQASFNIERVKYPKKFRIIIEDYNSTTPITIKNIQFRNGKYKFEDINKYVVNGAKSEVKNNSLVIYPKNEKIYITYTDKIKVKAPIKFNFEIFVIIFILSFLLIYKATDYVADFNTIKHKSRIDIIFLLVFFTFLFVPMSHINQDRISKQENRTLATWQPFIKKNGEINFNFGKNYEQWFNDRFNLRKFFVYTYSSINYYINKHRVINNKTKVFLDKQSGQMFVNNHLVYKKFTNKELDLYSKNLNKFLNFCNSKNIKTYVIFLPSINRYYQDLDKLHYKQKKDAGELLVKYIKKNYNKEIIYFEKELHEAEHFQPVFYKTDHHLTDWGSYTLYKYLIKKMRKDFPKLKTTPLNYFNISQNNLVRFDYNRKYTNGGSYDSLGIHNKKLLNTNYNYYDYKNIKNIKIEKLERTGAYKHTNPNGHYRLLIIGDSYQENLTYFLNTSFKEIYKYRSNVKPNEPKTRKSEFDMDYWEPIIERIKPDIILLNKHTGCINEFGKMYKGVK